MTRTKYNGRTASAINESLRMGHTETIREWVEDPEVGHHDLTREAMRGLLRRIDEYELAQHKNIEASISYAHARTVDRLEQELANVRRAWAKEAAGFDAAEQTLLRKNIRANLLVAAMASVVAAARVVSAIVFSDVRSERDALKVLDDTIDRFDGLQRDT